jgi:PAB-dependent poly(A)-specific ribonuclease subunit 2
VGHTLRKDFQMLNMVVPPDQIIDIVDLFRLPSHPQRNLGLRFLAGMI